MNSGGTYWGGAVVSFRLDMDAGTLKYYTNNTLVHTDSSIPTDGTTIFPLNSNTNSGVSRYNSIVSNFGQDSSFAGNKTAQGNTDENGIGDFYYAVPSGFRALCTKNLPKPDTIITKPQRHFDTILYTGDGQNNRKITGLEFKPGLVWLKQRAQSGGGEIDGNHGWYDSVRGVTKRLKSNSSGAEDTFAIGSFDDGGFTFTTETYYNANSDTFVAWCLKAGDATVTNNDGSSNTFNVDGTGYATAAAAGLDDGTISLTGASVNTEAGFSIVTYAGTDSGSSQTIPHGLNQPPEFWMWKNRSSSTSWIVYTTVIDGGSDYLLLNGINAASSGVSPWDTAPTSSVVTVGTNNADTCNAGDNYVLYLWHSVPGYSKFGKYTGNGSTNGTFVHLGFRPAWLMVKRTSSTDSWLITDNKRDVGNPATQTQAPQSHREDNVNTGDNYSIDYLSNGFKCRGSGGDLNGSGQTYLYMAFAGQPGTTPFDTFTNSR